MVTNSNSLSENAWIGLKWINDWTRGFQWTDGSKVDYENWSKDSVRNGEVKCARMSLLKNDVGKWIDESCKKTALVVCQKKIVINFDILLNAILKLENDNSAIKSEQKSQMNMLIPVGFVYTQLPDQPQPATLWPTFNWTDVTSTYAGLFFRAEGGGSEKFGSVQQDNSPRLESVYRHVINSTGVNDKGIIQTNSNGNAIFIGWHYFPAFRIPRLYGKWRHASRQPWK